MIIYVYIWTINFIHLWSKPLLNSIQEVVPRNFIVNFEYALTYLLYIIPIFFSNKRKSIDHCNQQSAPYILSCIGITHLRSLYDLQMSIFHLVLKCIRPSKNEIPPMLISIRETERTFTFELSLSNFHFRTFTFNSSSPSNSTRNRSCWLGLNSVALKLMWFTKYWIEVSLVAIEGVFFLRKFPTRKTLIQPSKWNNDS